VPQQPEFQRVHDARRFLENVCVIFESFRRLKTVPLPGARGFPDVDVPKMFADLEKVVDYAARDLVVALEKLSGS
jgi:hypothetical protein